MPAPRRIFAAKTAVAFALAAGVGSALAQEPNFDTTGQTLPAARLPQQTPPRFYPLQSNMPPGYNAHFAAMIRQPMPTDITFVKLVLPSVGTVEVFGGQPLRSVPLPEGWCGLSIGHVYRFRIAGLGELPGVELWPTIEVLDRTHPPPGREREFAVPLRLSLEEIEQALAGQLLTKVVYVEQPQLATSLPTVDGVVVQTVPAGQNLLQEADLRGRPVAIIRLGARTPDPHRPEPEFWGSGGPVALVPTVQLPTESQLPESPIEPPSPANPPETLDPGPIFGPLN